MALEVAETNYGQQEGGDKLKTFLLENQNKLKKAVDPIYELLTDEDIDYEELMEFAECDLRKAITENDKVQLKSTQVARLVNLLRTIPESQIYKESNKTEKIVKVLVSTEEEAAMNKISESSARIKQNILNIDNTINLLKENKSKNQQIIQKQFDAIISAATKRKQELIQNLDKMVDDKSKLLNKQSNDLQVIELALNESYNKSQEMLNNISIDTIKRKSKILQNTQQVFNAHNILSNINNFAVITSPNINIHIDVNDIITNILTVGKVINKDKPKAPQLAVVSTNDYCVQLNIKSTEKEIRGYKLEYREYDDDDKEDDSKMEWNNINIDTRNKNVNHEIKSLKPSTNYLFYACVKTQTKVGHKSKPLRITTNKLRKFTGKWDTNYISNGHNLTNNGRCIEIKEGWKSSYGTVVKSPGVYRWKFKINKLAGTGYWILVLGVWKNKTKSQPVIDDYFTTIGGGNNKWGYAFDVTKGCKIQPIGNSSGGKAYGRKCVVGDIVEMVLDLDAFTLKYIINDHDYGIMHQVENTEYRVAVTSNASGTSVEML